MRFNVHEDTKVCSLLLSELCVKTGLLLVPGTPMSCSFSRKSAHLMSVRWNKGSGMNQFHLVFVPGKNCNVFVDI